ncbi:hypothetical protein IEQ34_017609 [Dendrobium chrysotoxum]|uniref:Uncharacterized protein n=1 Tax=Dendrobium chrysotoxum TaxID=161865 RepID=A0AAV7FU94_DENCH|nr:hypothetical protein IEQ34_017609 [Dendrobium chrysotoxum]
MNLLDRSTGPVQPVHMGPAYGRNFRLLLYAPIARPVLTEHEKVRPSPGCDPPLDFLLAADYTRPPPAAKHRRTSAWLPSTHHSDHRRLLTNGPSDYHRSTTTFPSASVARRLWSIRPPSFADYDPSDHRRPIMTTIIILFNDYFLVTVS